MSTTIANTIKEITGWPVNDQVELLHQVWDHLLDSGWQPDLTDTQKESFDRRLESLEKNPNEVVTWEAIVEHVRRPK